MGATLSEQWDSKSEEDEEQHSGQYELPEDSAEDKLLWKNGQISGQDGKTESQTDETDSLSEERDHVDVGSGFVTLNEDASDMTNSIQEGDDSNNSSKQINDTDEVITKEENEADNNVNDTQIGFKKIFSFGGFKFTLKKDKVEKISESEPDETEQNRNAAGPSEDTWDNAGLDEKDMKNEIVEGDFSAGPPRTHSKMTVGTADRDEGTPDKRLMQDVPQSPEPEKPMSPIKQFFSQGILSSLKKKKKENERLKESKDELKSLDKLVEKESTKEDNTCSCLDVSKGFDEDKDLHLYRKDESKPGSEGDIIHPDKVQASPFKRLFRKVSTKRHSEPKPGDTNLLKPGEKISENSQLSTELVMSQKEHETEVVDTQPGNQMMDRSHEDSKKKSDSAVSWENLLCVRSSRTRSRKTSDSEEETQAKEGVHRGTNDSPFESSTEGDHLTSSNEQGESPAEDDSGSTWKSFKKLVTPKRKSRVEESGSLEQMHLETEITEDESSCSLRKLISGRKKIKSDGQQECISSDEGSKGTGTDIEDDETPGVVPLSEYELAEPKILEVSTDGAGEIKKEDEMEPIISEDKPTQIQPLYNVEPLRFDTWPSSVPVPTEYMEDLTEFLSKHQQLSDIPEEGIVEESIATPLSFVEWTTQYDTLDDDIVDITADAVTAPEDPSEHNEDETSEMVSAVSHLSESPKTSGNVTPVSPVHYIRVSDTIFQEVLESSCMVPSVLSDMTQDKMPEAQTVSVSQFIVESTTTTKTKLLVAHKKEEASSICIGILCNKIRAEAVHPLPLFEGISEINYVLPTEFVSEDFTEVCEAAEMATDNVSEAENHNVLSLEKQKTILAETATKSEQQLLNIGNVPEEVSPVVQIKKEPVFKIEKEQRIEDELAADEKQLQVTKVAEPVGHCVVACKSDAARNHASEITEDMAGVVVSDVKCLMTTALLSSVIPLSDSIKIETDLKHEAQMETKPLTHVVDTDRIEGMPTPNPTEKGEETKKPAAVYEQKRVSEAVAEERIQQPARDSLKPTFSKMIRDTQTTAEATGYKEKHLAITNIVSGSYLNDKLDKLELNGTVNTEITTELETLETVKLFPEVKLQCDPVETQTEAVPLKPEKNEATKSRHESHKEKNQATETAFKATKTIQTETIMCKDKTKVTCNTSDQLKPQKEMLKPEEAYATESAHEKINQVPNTAKISKSNLSVYYEEDTEVEYKTSNQTVQSIDKEPVSTTKHVKKAMSKDKAETPESLVISQTEWSVHVTKAITDNIGVFLDKVNKHELKMTVDSEKNIVPPDETKQEKVSETDTATAVDAIQNTEPTEALKLKDKTIMIVSEGAAVVTSEQVAESSNGTENKREAGVLKQLINKPKAETPEMADLKADIIVVSGLQAETPVFASLLPDLKAGQVILEATEPKLDMLLVKKTLAHTSVVPAVDVQTTGKLAIATETTMGTCEEDESVVMAIHKYTDVDSLVLSHALSEVQLKAEAQRLTVVSVIEKLTEIEVPFTGPELKEIHCDAQAAANIEDKHVAEIIEQVAKDMENTKNPRKDFKIPEVQCEESKEVSVSIMNMNESLPGANEDVWEDAIEDVRDFQCSRTKASDSL
ncbi:A-kinase anchor protein 12 [Bagarius yarrelli]|uniref:A-kinase anchor protein 12 n=1 Tax=Bagarius yarrelli TaxID=175774 RepID=A0A556U961_BAGYA|nr:A-kinase anchor protein 12 [Bagarius yarrelli]